MLQRIQSLYLFIASVMMAALYKIPLLSLKSDTEVFIISYEGMTDFASQELISQNLTGFILFLAAVLLPLATIFMFKNRKFQIKLTNYTILLNAAFLLVNAYYVFQIFKQLDVKIGFELGMLLPVLSIVFLFLAKRYIRKDEELIRSVDRIR